MNQRNINWLIERRIIFRRDPINDKPTSETHQYKYYEDGTYECYHLFLEEIIQDVLTLGGDPPKNKRRKIIFKMSTGLSTREKLSIVGKLIGRSKLDKETLYQSMIDINSDGIKITVRWLAEILGVSKRTIYRHMCEDLRREKEILNEEL